VLDVEIVPRMWGALMLLKEKVALVTGAGSGIGRAIAVILGREGARVAVTDNVVESGMQTVELLTGSGVDAAFFRLDVASAQAHEEVIRSVEDRFGRLDVACNNAGISTGPSRTYKPLAEVILEDWHAMLNVNLSGAFYGLRAQIPALLRSGGGAIVNIASVMGQVAAQQLSPYVASKHGVVGLTRAAALDYASQNIRINAIGPGYVDTPMLVQKDAVTRTRLAAAHPIGRLAQAEEIAELAVWLSSSRASFITGAYYPVDGGYLAQ
jgi:NAD(P)-dependent dehydrogenase (short-subunit alcohol dehydrogenase family)